MVKVDLTFSKDDRGMNTSIKPKILDALLGYFSQITGGFDTGKVPIYDISNIFEDVLVEYNETIKSLADDEKCTNRTKSCIKHPILLVCPLPHMILDEYEETHYYVDHDDVCNMYLLCTTAIDTNYDKIFGVVYKIFVEYHDMPIPVFDLIWNTDTNLFCFDVDLSVNCTGILMHLSEMFMDKPGFGFRLACMKYAINCRLKNNDCEYSTNSYEDDLVDGVESVISTFLINAVETAMDIINNIDGVAQFIKTETKSYLKMTGRKRIKTSKFVEWKTIDIGTMKQIIAKSKHGSEGFLRTIAKAHTVRGHFKTYTEENPHLGKNVGTYWWSTQVRGDRAKGEIKHIYRVNNPEANNEVQDDG